MSKYEQTLNIICENCGKRYNKSIRIYTITNTDLKSRIANDLRDDKLNRTTCPYCNTSFTYERPHLAFSLTKSYAILAMGNKCPDTMQLGSTNIFDLFGIYDMKFRLVEYQCEVAEKIRIFDCGLDDIAIEQLKYENFDKSYFADKSDKILVFKEICNDKILFEYRDFADNPLGTHYISIEKYNKCCNMPQPVNSNDGYVVWTKTDYNYIKEKNNDNN